MSIYEIEKDRYLDVLIITNTRYESHMINKNSNDKVLAKCFGSQVNGFRAESVILAYDDNLARDVYGDEYTDKYENYVRYLNRGGLTYE